MKTAVCIVLLSFLAGCDSGPPPMFTEADRNQCLSWPVCPVGVVGSTDMTQLRVFPVSCRANTGAPVTCGACVDTRTPACGDYVGPCIAPNWPRAATAYCGDIVAPVNPAGIGWTICTGPAQAPDGYATLVCGASAGP